MKKPLTPNQKRLYDAIKSLSKKNGFAPTYKDLADEIVKMPGEVFAMVSAMERNGWVTREAGKSRSLHVV